MLGSTVRRRQLVVVEQREAERAKATGLRGRQDRGTAESLSTPDVTVMEVSEGMRVPIRNFWKCGETAALLPAGTAS
jgi:hypothetical protein